jgi:hypothetical protein
MRKLKLFTLLASLTSLLAVAGPLPNGLMTANAGTRFTLVPNGTGAFTHTVDGLAQVSVIGDCLVHFDVVAEPQPTGEWKGTGTAYFLNPKDGSILRLKGTARVTPEPNSPIANFHYDLEIISGEGQFAGARGSGEIDGAALFIDDQGNGTTTWIFRGHVFTHGSK